MTRTEAVELAQGATARPARANRAKPAPEPVGKITEVTLQIVRRDCPGWDYAFLHDQFRAWLQGDASRTPANYQNAFIGFVRSYHERHKHELPH
jgi:hypothetical protein